MTRYKLQRIYDTDTSSDSYRVLVDRLWPRSISKQQANLDVWAKDIAPSPELRTWFNHDPARFEEFSARYEHELAHNPAVQEFVRSVQDKPSVVLLYGAKDTHINHVVVLKRFLDYTGSKSHKVS